MPCRLRRLRGEPQAHSVCCDPDAGEPDYEAPYLPEWDDPQWVRWELDHLGELPIHPQEILDNMADVRHDKVGHLRMSMYGTRDAAMNWAEEVAKEMRKVGFRRGRYNPCLYDQEARKLKTFLHGDDFATVGTREEVAWSDRL